MQYLQKCGVSGQAPSVLIQGIALAVANGPIRACSSIL